MNDVIPEGYGDICMGNGDAMEVGALRPYPMKDVIGGRPW